MFRHGYEIAYFAKLTLDKVNNLDLSKDNHCKMLSQHILHSNPFHPKRSFHYSRYHHNIHHCAISKVNILCKHIPTIEPNTWFPFWCLEKFDDKFQGPIVSGHVLISWSNTSNSASCFGDNLRCVRFSWSKHGASQSALVKNKFVIISWKICYKRSLISYKYNTTGPSSPSGPISQEA